MKTTKFESLKNKLDQNKKKIIEAKAQIELLEKQAIELFKTKDKKKLAIIGKKLTEEEKEIQEQLNELEEQIDTVLSELEEEQ